MAAGHTHAPGFLALVNAARARVHTLAIPEYLARRDAGERFVLVDVREDHEWEAGRVPGAIHLSKGIIERDIEAAVPDHAAAIVCYCGGGFRSVLVCDNLRQMGYRDVISLDGGWRGWNEAGLPIDAAPAPR